MAEPETGKRAHSSKLFHPLCGADLGTLARVVGETGIGAHAALPLAIAALVGVLKSPLSGLERVLVRERRSPFGVHTPPTFILGHWRSGTTHLYNVMSKASHWGFVSPFATALPWDFLVIGRLFGPLLAQALPSDRFIDSIPVEVDSPQEDEIGLANMTPLSFYHGLYFPSRFETFFNRGVFFDGVSARERTAWENTLRYYYDKLSIAADGKPLLIKNPVYTARPGQLRALWPDAKFIHIHRNPYKVFVSMRNFYARLFEEFALEPFGHLDIDAIILSSYTRMMERFSAETAGLPAHQFVEVSFETFQRNPLAELARIYDQLALPGYGEALPAFTRYLASVEGYQKNTYAFPVDVRERVAKSWAPFIERWSYAPPP